MIMNVLSSIFVYEFTYIILRLSFFNDYACNLRYKNINKMRLLKLAITFRLNYVYRFL